MTEKDSHEVRQAVRDHYAAVAVRADDSCCAPAAAVPSCCDPAPNTAMAACKTESRDLGYDEIALAEVPEGSDLGLGCGNPVAIASLRPGQTVLDLGSGGGLDCFLSARRVGPEGRVIGVDMTPEMLARARANAARAGFANVEFRLGEIEHLPVADGSVDVVMSNCVINLSPQKAAVFREIFRVLKPGGRVCVSDVVATSDLPDALTGDLTLVACCIGGASPVADITRWLEEAGFADVSIAVNEASRAVIAGWAPGTGAERYVASAIIAAVRP